MDMVGTHINWFDLVIVLVLAVLIWRGIKDGLATQVLANAGFFGGLFLGGWLFPHLIAIPDKNLRAIISGNLVIAFAIVAGFFGFRLGRYLHILFGKGWLHQMESYLSVLFSVVFGLLGVWLLAAMIGSLPFEGFSNSANDSLIVQTLDRNLPPVPAVVAEFYRQVNYNGPHDIFLKTSAQVERYVPISSPAIKAAAAEDESAIVRITGFGCGGILSGSGFAAEPDLVITDAHVIAGIHRPIIKYGTQSYVGVPVFFDSSLDLAALRVPRLHAKPLQFFGGDVMVGTAVGVLGYPENDYTVLPGVVAAEQPDLSPNIYGVGSFERQIYGIEAAIENGSSGSPMILADGRVAGIIFAKDSSANGFGYALASSGLLVKLQQAKQSTNRVGTGICASNH